MKYFFLLATITLFLFSCGNSSDSKKENKEVKTITTITYQADTSKSNVLWQRDVENKVENKQIQIFGATATVSMENVAYTSNGDMPVLGGKLVYLNDTLKEMELTVNFTMVRLFSKSSSQAISSEKFPPSLMSIKTISPDTVANQFILKGDLTIKDKTGPVEFVATIKKAENKTVSLAGTLVLQTLNWPIREDTNEANVNKDLITLSMNLVFANRVEKTDTIK
ncbi:MAG: hypothetical protein CVU11_08700 [Bacteroidetes bacterium HGW-Bacteroidetes-6]|jgi:polyisoprenoid-binding protein YceI|nr:MAG: hypothetical protein CVU11_08700 [Bacteroidetes bacterium HGW-Bacteroidetes-6]